MKGKMSASKTKMLADATSRSHTSNCYIDWEKEALWSSDKAQDVAKNVKETSTELSPYDDEAASMMEKGLALHKQGKRELALQMLSLSRQRIKGPENPQLAALHMYSGAILFECESYRDAISHFRSAHKILKKNLGSQDPTTIVAETQVRLTMRKIVEQEREAQYEVENPFAF